MIKAKSNIGFYSYQEEVTLKMNNSICPVFDPIRDFNKIHLILQFQEEPIKTEQIMLTTKARHCFFQQIRGRNPKINNPIWPVFKFMRDFIRLHPICKFQADWILADEFIIYWWQRQILALLAIQVRNSKTNSSMWLPFELLLDFIPVHFICKVRGDPIKTEGVLRWASILPLYVYWTFLLL